MIRTILLVTLSLLILHRGIGQAHFPTSSDDPIWSETEYTQFGFIYENGSLGMIGDTIINDTNYSALYSLKDSLLTKDGAVFLGGIREDESQKIWFWKENKKKLLYDFNVGLNDTIWFLNNEGYLFDGDFIHVTYIDSIELENGEKRRRLRVDSHFGFGEWIEGIGSTWGLLNIIATCPEKKSANPVFDCFSGTSLICHYNKSQLLYKDCYGSCFSTNPSLITALSDKNLPEIFPNPAIDYIQLLDEEEEIAGIEIYSLSGILLLAQPVQPNTLINISELDKGIYLICFYTQQGDIGQSLLVKE